MLVADQSACEALTEFARRVIADDIDSDHLAHYLEELLSVQLVEPHASCRQAVMHIIHCGPALGSCEVADCLLVMARALRNPEQDLENARPMTCQPVGFFDTRSEDTFLKEDSHTIRSRILQWMKRFSHRLRRKLFTRMRLHI